MHIKSVSLIFLSVFLSVFLIFANRSEATEFNYDTYGKYEPFKWNENNCEAVADTLQKIARNLKSVDLSYLQKSQWTCDNLGELRSAGSMAIGRINEAVNALASFQDNCMCSSYVALRLKTEGYDSARSGGESLNFSKAQAIFDDAKVVAGAIAPQLDILSKFDRSSRTKGQEFCKKDSAKACSEQIRAEHCGDYDVLKEMSSGSSYPIRDVFRYIRHVGGRAYAVQQKTANGIDSLTDYKGPAPYCQNTWGDPKSCPPKMVNEKLANGMSSKRVWDACGIPSDGPGAPGEPGLEGKGKATN